MSQHGTGTEEESRIGSHRRRRRSTSNFEGTPPPPTPSYRRILVGTLCFCVPSLLLSSWQSTNQWNFRSVLQEATVTVYQSEAQSNAITWRSAVVVEDTFHFCIDSRVKAKEDDFPPAQEQDQSLTLLYQCEGPQYEAFADALQNLAYDQSIEASGAFERMMYDASGFRKRTLLPQHGACEAIRSETMPTAPLWGRRFYPLPDNAAVLVLGNSHLRQISKTLACQYAASSLKSIRFLPSLHSLLNDPTETSDARHSDGFVLEFDNGSRWISITNTVLVYSESWVTLLEDFFLSALSIDFTELDTIVMGKFTTFEEAQHTNYERTMAMEQNLYDAFQQQWLQQEKATDFLTMERRIVSDMVDDDDMRSMVVDFNSIPPPDLVDLARVYDGPIISVNMFSKSDEFRFEQSYQMYQEECELSAGMNDHVYLVNGRRYIDQLRMECGTDDKHVIGTCHESASNALLSSFSEDRDLPRVASTSTGKRPRDPSDMHRCTGYRGGHADLIAWDVIEGVHWMMAEYAKTRNTLVKQ
jgi:hypothetical protein